MKSQNPMVTVDAAGVWLHLPDPDGPGTRAVLLSQDSAHALIGELAGKLELLKTSTEMQKKLASKIAELAIDWIARRRGST